MNTLNKEICTFINSLPYPTECELLEMAEDIQRKLEEINES